MPRDGTALDWRNMAISDTERYQLYLCSREWAEKRQAVRSRCNGMCERCRNAPMSHVHHLTYERKFNEDPADLQGLCLPCHEYTHGRRDRDPMLDVAVATGMRQTC